MGTLTYTTAMSLDGYAADANGDFQWTAPGDDVFDFHIERLEAVSTEVLGRRTYQLMTYWDVDPVDEEWTEAEREFARRWRALDVIVASSTVDAADLGARDPRVVRHLGLDELRRIVTEAPGEVEIFGPTLAGPAIRAGLVQDFRLLVVPKIVGGGLRALPSIDEGAPAPGHSLDLDLVEQRVFRNGTVLLHHRSR